MGLIGGRALTERVCPGDILSFNCSASSDVDSSVILVWSVTNPGQEPVVIRYNTESSLDVFSRHDETITTVLTRAQHADYISILTLQPEMSQFRYHTTIIECALVTESSGVTIGTDSVQIQHYVAGMCHVASLLEAASTLILVHAVYMIAL